MSNNEDSVSRNWESKCTESTRHTNNRLVNTRIFETTDTAKKVAGVVMIEFDLISKAETFEIAKMIANFLETQIKDGLISQNLDFSVVGAALTQD